MIAFYGIMILERIIVKVLDAGQAGNDATRAHSLRGLIS